MPDISDFCIIAIRVKNSESTGKKILVEEKLYPLMKGYEIHNDEIIIKTKDTSLATLYDGFIGQHHIRNVNISAIVGANGSGKSSLVEFMLRLINNMAASLFGEEDLHPGAERIHYIKGVYGEMYFLLNKVPHRLNIEGNIVELYEYEHNEQIGADAYDKEYRYRQKPEPLYKRTARQAWRGGDKIFYSKWRKKRKAFQKVADHFFYTFVSNYSMYAYNRNDFTEEFDDDGKGCWLEGIFHKNDGYQTPIVLTPYREKGNMDVNKEAKLSNERLVALLLQDVGFKKLNGHLEVASMQFADNGKDYGRDYVNEECDTAYKLGAFTRLRYFVSKAWESKYNCRFKTEEHLPLREKAIDYLASKTIKVAMKYGQYTSYFEQIKNVTKRPKMKHKRAIIGLVEALSNDDSHITTKIRQTIGYLKTGRFKEPELTLSQAINKCKASMHSMKDDLRGGMPILFGKVEDTLPPPFLKVTIKLKEENGTEVTLDKLSSGERQQIFSISSVLYHLSNISSVHNDRNKKRVEYNRVCVILEEIELYFHPQLQREFIKYLLDGLRQVRLVNLLAVSVIIVTHSPFVLSDIPTANILPLEDGEPKDRKLQSFGANIHDILNSNFFMEEGAKGLFAEWIITEILKALAIYSKPHNRRTGKEGTFLVNYPQVKLRRLIETIDEPIVRKLLAEQYEEVFGEEMLETQITALEAQLEALKNRRN